MKKIFITILAAVLLAFAVSAVEINTGAYRIQRTYNGEFTDVPQSAWYYNEVASAYSLGLIDGVSATTFDADGNLTIAQLIKLASSCHQLLTTGETTAVAAIGSNWYDGYVAYATKYGIVTEEYENYNAAATRGQVAVLFSRMLTAAQDSANIDEINAIAFGDLPDVDTSAWYASAVYRMYRCGIMTGDSAHLIYPESLVKRGEISAVLIRVVDTSARVQVDGSTATQTPSVTVPSIDPTPTQTYGKITLYDGIKTAQSFSGITGVAADFTISEGISTLDSAYSLSLINNVELESDCLSFRLYDGCGYEALGIVRGWLNNEAVGQNGEEIDSIVNTYDGINGLMYIYINGVRIPVSQLWYADHRGSDEVENYTTYAFYFVDSIDLSTVSDLKFMCGKLDASVLETNGLTELSNLNQSTTVPAYQSQTTVDSVVNDIYTSAVNDVKQNAYEIIFEYESDRCRILYGRGLYGGGASDYRLVMVFHNGTTQTVYVGELESIRINSTGDVLYYSVMGPDGKTIDYGVNYKG